ncbi:MAG: hypothetical protein M1292_07875 [Bacteroidetes bacterium]|nr:hypothetical protein [Bacteroidota bacterium]
MRAKTFASNNGWTSPVSLSTFGIPIPQQNPKKHLGLEEFNFIKIMKDRKLAYIPCFSSSRAGSFDIDLFYLNDVNHTTYHYATLKGVRSIQKNEIAGLRQDLITAGLPQWVANDARFQDNYGPELFPIALEKWNLLFNCNNIIANRTDDRFILNVRYEELIQEEAVRVGWNNLHFASRLYPNEANPLAELADLDLD